MINNDYLVDMKWCDSGGYCDFLPIRGHQNLGFKNFKHKKRAEESLYNQKILAKFDLAPEPITDLCKIPYGFDPELLKTWNPKETTTNWGYVTEKALMLDIDADIPYRKIQQLVDNIRETTRLKFWDCHMENIGYIKRGRKKKLVCIDTGEESFQGYCNAWGYEAPGPKCPYCNIYACECSTIYDSEE